MQARKHGGESPSHPSSGTPTKGSDFMTSSDVNEMALEFKAEGETMSPRDGDSWLMNVNSWIKATRRKQSFLPAKTLGRVRLIKQDGDKQGPRQSMEAAGVGECDKRDVETPDHSS